jgi:ATP-binding cassette subfamily B protein
VPATDPNPRPHATSPWDYARRYRIRIAIGVSALLVTNILALTVPYLLGRTVDALRGPSPAADVRVLAIWMVVFAVGQAVVRVVSRVSIFNAARMAEHDLRSDLFAHLVRLEPAYYRTHSTGDVMSRLTNDVQTVRALWGPGILNVVNTTFVFLTAMVLMVHIDPVLTLWALLPYPAIFLLGRVFGRQIHRASREVQEQLGALSNDVQEDLSGVAIIKGYTLEESRRERFRLSSEVLLWRNMSLTKIRGLLMPLLGGLASLGTVMVIWIGGTAVVEGRIGLGQMVQFNAYLALLLWPTMALGWMISLFQRGLASWTRLQEIFAREPSVVSGDASLPKSDGPCGHLELRDLTIRLGERNVLDGVSLDIPAGTVTALVGRTGCGKSVLVDALPRLVDVPAGTVFLDGVDITTLDLAELRGAIGYAPQEAFLFSTSIARNIAFGMGPEVSYETESNDDLPLERIDLAARAAGLTRDLAALPHGLDTVVGERGITLSGGQRQRVALARALATDPRVIVLDDSLSSVDAETEAEILGRLGDVLAGRTAIIISHRVAAVQRADRIIVLDDGRVAESGTHAELLAAGGVYAELYRDQLDDQIAEVGAPLLPEPREATEAAEAAEADR